MKEKVHGLDSIRGSIHNSFEKIDSLRSEIFEIFFTLNGVVRVLYLYGDDLEELSKGVFSLLESNSCKLYKAYSAKVYVEEIFSLPFPNVPYLMHWRSRMINLKKGYGFSELNEKDKVERLLASNWILQVSLHSETDEYFTVLQIYPAVYQPPYSVGGYSMLRDSLVSACSFIRHESELNADPFRQTKEIDPTHDRLRVGLVFPPKRSIHYINDRVPEIALNTFHDCFDEKIEKLEKCVADEFRHLHRRV